MIINNKAYDLLIIDINLLIKLYHLILYHENYLLKKIILKINKIEYHIN